MFLGIRLPQTQGQTGSQKNEAMDSMTHLSLNQISAPVTWRGQHPEPVASQNKHAISDLYTAQSISGTGPIAIHNPNQSPVLVYLPPEFMPYQTVLATHTHLNPTTQAQLAQTYFTLDASRITPVPFEPLFGRLFN